MSGITVIRALALGDMLCAVPTLRAIRAVHPDAHVALIGLPWAQVLVDRLPYVDELIEFPGFPGIPEVPLDPARTVACLADLQRRRFDLAVQLQGDGLVINEFVALLGAARLAGFVPPGLRPPCDGADDTWLPYPAGGHEVDRLLELAKALGAAADDRRLEFPLTDTDRVAADRLLDEHLIDPADVAVVHPGGSRPDRRWPADRFAAVADALAGRDLAVVLTGTKAEASATARVGASMRGPFVELAGRTDLGTMAALVERARIVVTNDTGISHLAGALDTDSVTVFVASDRERWAPLGSERNLAVGEGVPDTADGRGGADGRQRGPDVPVADVMAAVGRLLSGPGLID
jgi:ADP-heptose:LPS heptosyltransferase